MRKNVARRAFMPECDPSLPRDTVAAAANPIPRSRIHVSTNTQSLSSYGAMTRSARAAAASGVDPEYRPAFSLSPWRGTEIRPSA
jgi:hypothetical protein